MPRSPGGVCEVAHGGTGHVLHLLHMTHLTRPVGRRVAAKELSGRSARSLGAEEPAPQSAPGTGWKPWNRRRDARRGPGGNLAPSLCGKLLLKRGPVSKFFLYPLIRFLKLGEGIPRLVVLVWLASEPGGRPPSRLSRSAKGVERCRRTDASTQARARPSWVYSWVERDEVQ